MLPTIMLVHARQPGEHPPCSSMPFSALLLMHTWTLDCQGSYLHVQFILYQVCNPMICVPEIAMTACGSPVHNITCP